MNIGRTFIEGFFTNIVSLCIGIVGSLLAASFYERWKIFRENTDLDLLGTWVEVLKYSDDRRTSAGTIYFDKYKKMFKYDGTNYANGGDKYSHWQTLASYIDIQQKRLFYMFSAHLEGELGPSYFGFGVINLTLKSHKLTPTDGWFCSPSLDTKAQSHSMIRADFSYERDADGKKTIDFLNRQKV